MKFYSEKLKKLYDTEAELHKAESAYDDVAAKKEKERRERADAAKAIDEKYKEKAKVEAEYSKMVADFCKKYGSYHKTYTNCTVPKSEKDPLLTLVESFIDPFF